MSRREYDRDEAQRKAARRDKAKPGRDARKALRKIADEQIVPSTGLPYIARKRDDDQDDG